VTETEKSNIKLQFWDAVWDLRVAECPCDLQFLDWLDREHIRDASIFHFGTGSHHIVGVQTSENGSGNCVLGITASPKEHDAFVELVIDRPDVERTYKVLFGDIYQLEKRLLPEFDVVTLFHLCEFRTEQSDAYGAMTDRQLLDLLTQKTRPGGYILFYTKSFAFDDAQRILKSWEQQGAVEKAGVHELLLVYRKTAQVAMV
jgi:hypothetical protein